MDVDRSSVEREWLLHQTRRLFLKDSLLGLGGLWLATQGGRSASAADIARDPAHPWSVQPPHFKPKATRVIYVHLAGSPSQLELFDYKPVLEKYSGKDCPAQLLKGKQFAFIQGIPKLLGPVFPFHKAGQSGQWISDRLPHLEKVIDELCFIKSMWTDQFNHGPAQLLIQTGNQNVGSPAMGAWALYGLGTENDSLPGFIVLTSGGKNPDAGKSVWGSGFLPSVYQGIQCRSQGDPVLFLSNPKGVTSQLRRRTLDALAELNQQTAAELGDPETRTRIAQYEMAFRMQVKASEAFDITRESKRVHQAYGTEPGKESFANNCLLARRLVERGVRFVQLYDWGWDSHGASASEALNAGFKNKCAKMDRPMAALVKDLKDRGLLDETLIIWGGEFGRTSMQENRRGMKMKFIGRDHNPFAFTIWMAGGGVKAGYTHGETDELGFQSLVDPVSIPDFHATVLALLGFDHLRLTYPVQGVNQRLTNVTKPGSQVVKAVMA